MGLQRDALIKLARSWSGRMDATLRPSPKKRIDIEALLRWAYLAELPKRPPMSGPGDIDSAWNMVGRAFEEMSLAGPGDNRYGVVPDFAASSWPHPDAYVVHDRVCELDELELGVPDGWDPIEDLGDLGALGAAAIARAIGVLTTVNDAGLRVLRQPPRRLVFRHAILGGCPDFAIVPPERKLATAHGKTRWFRRKLVWVGDEAGNEALGRWVELEVDGFDSRAKRPYDDAYPKEYLDPDPIDSLIGRAEYEIWRSALVYLVESLAGGLSDFDVVMSARSAQPWIEGEPRKPFIWPDLSPRAAQRWKASPKLVLDVAAARRALEANP